MNKALAQLKEAEEEHWVKPDKATRMLRKKSIHKHDGDAAILAAGAAGKAKAPHLEAATDVAEHAGEEEHRAHARGGLDQVLSKFHWEPRDALEVVGRRISATAFCFCKVLAEAISRRVQVKD